MTIQTTDGQVVILDDGLNTGITDFDVHCAVGVVAQGTACLMERIDSACTAPGIGKLRCADTADGVAGITGSTVG